VTRRYATEVRLARGRWVAALVVLAVSGVVLAPPAAAKTRNPGAEWDPRVLPVARAVEKIRGLKFAAPVRVRFLSKQAFDAEEDVPFLPEERRGLRREERMQRALGLLAPGDEYAKAIEEAGNVGVLAYYYENEITMRGGSPDKVSTQYVLSHELTHALQDDYFAQFAPPPLASGADPPGYVALLEGDADRVADEWLSQQSKARKRRFDREYARTGTEVEQAIEGAQVPEILTVSGRVPYTYGVLWTQAIVDEGGQAALNRRFRDPPGDDAAILNLFRSDGATRLSQPPLDRGDHKIGDATTMGALGLFSLLSSRIDPQVALRAADEWDGDRVVLFDRDGVDCVRARFRGHGTAGAATVNAALTDWAIAVGTATVTSRRDDTTVTACGTPATAPISVRATELVPLVRNRLVEQSLAKGRSPATIDCILHTYFDDGVLSAALLGENPEKDALSKGTQALLDQRRAASRAACGITPGN